MNGKIGLIFNGVWSQYALATAPKYRDIYCLLYVHELSDLELDELDALVIPFQSHQAALCQQQQVLYNFLKSGRKVVVFGDSTPEWMDADWEDRPTNNYWWVEDPENPPISHTDFNHPVFQGLKPRHACWHIHGVYTRIPDEATVIQRNETGENITWQTNQYGGTLLASTLDPIVEHGIQQIRHLDHFVDSLTHWLCGIRPTGSFKLPAESYGVSLG
ncbi:hypothetical protein Pan153_52640 [Gimesia panareensis]|uniref:Uncharacterized protein n=1 Tax=Gimesia panareensis TaxID=2527978 RepID=A0A518FW61_9PLAN|nr:hypothetical protein [Gimesia panareensis]QDV20588.1 hypothetical protein Pan153_52640 [Gimesia panareensis]